MRPSWTQYFLAQALLAAMRSTCLRRQTGAVIARQNKVIATGYNGAPRFVSHCNDDNITCGENYRYSGSCRGSHSIANAIAQAAEIGSSIAGGTVYCTHFPCSSCAKLIINSGITQVYYIEEQLDEMAQELLYEAEITCAQYMVAQSELFNILDKVGICQ